MRQSSRRKRSRRSGPHGVRRQGGPGRDSRQRLPPFAERLKWHTRSWQCIERLCTHELPAVPELADRKSFITSMITVLSPWLGKAQLQAGSRKTTGSGPPPLRCVSEGVPPASSPRFPRYVSGSRWGGMKTCLHGIDHAKSLKDGMADLSTKPRIEGAIEHATAQRRRVARSD
jgi:hypothetical protein